MDGPPEAPTAQPERGWLHEVRLTRLAAATVLAAVAVGLAACRRGAEHSADTVTEAGESSASGASVAATSPSGGRNEDSLATLGPTRHEAAPGTGVATLTAVRTAARDSGGVRIVFELREPEMPGYSVEYAQGEPTACGSGHRVSVAGDAYLLVRLAPAQAHEARGGEQVSTISPRDRKPEIGPLRQLTLTCDFEGVVQWVLGLQQRRAYRAFTLTGPTRLVIDVSADSASGTR